MINMIKPKVSIIIPTYNRAKTIIKAIDSILYQTYKDYEIIIIDDGSTDNTKETIQSYLAIANIYYYRQENKKTAAARNFGIKKSKGDYIAFLDSDDLWFPRKLEMQVKILSENPDVGAVGSNQMLIDENGKELGLKYSYNKLKSGFIFKELLLRKFYISTQTLLVRKEVFNDVGLFDEKLKNALEDWELTLRIAQKYRIIMIKQPLIKRTVRRNPESISYLEFRIKNHQYILKKYLNNSLLTKSFIRFVWSKALYSYGYIYLTNGIYKKAFKNFFRSFLKGNIISVLGMICAVLGPMGRNFFKCLINLKEKVRR